MGKYLLVFASDEKYVNASSRLIKQANNTKIFDDIYFIQPSGFPDYFKSFINSHSSLFSNYTRGFGYWIWKPFLIDWHFKNKLKHDDILLYIDSGCEISIFGTEILLDYFTSANTYGGLFFTSNHIEKYWTKMDLIHYIKSFNDINSKQIAATFFFLQNNPNNRKLVETWYNIACIENHRFIDDSESAINNAVGFNEHRHDQSILSLLVKKNKLKTIGFDFYYNRRLYYPNSFILKYPIHALRNISDVSLLDEIIVVSENQIIESNISYIKFVTLNFWVKFKHTILIFFLTIKYNYFKTKH